jgi:arabinofuranosyltransferase
MARPRSLLDGPAPLALLGALLVVVLTRAAWLCDDAYITFRVVDNFWHGFGLRWNVAERVQVYTHPLWLLLLIALRPLTGELYYTTVFASLLLSLLAVGIVAASIATSRAAATSCVALLLCSKAFTDYCSSGLENPLLNVLLAAFLAAVLRGAPPALTFAAAGLVCLTRPDALLLIAPALLWAARLTSEPEARATENPASTLASASGSDAARRRWSRRRLARAVALGFAPCAAWALFATVYYGSPTPNTALAKLATGLPRAELLRQGAHYLHNSLVVDPATLPLIALAIAVAAWRRRPGLVAVALGILAHLAYVVWIGGDFMSGRFLAAPALCAVAILARGLSPGPQTAAVIVIGALALGVSSHRAPLRAGVDYGVHPRGDAMVDGRGVADERGYYYPFTGLLRVIGQDQIPNHHWALDGRRARLSGPRVVQRTAVGFFACLAGPEVHVVDPYALTDPLLARLPLDRSQGWRVGHYPRALPKGYLETLRSGRNRIADPRIAALWDDVARATRGPLWARGRWESLIRLNLPGRAQR